MLLQSGSHDLPGGDAPSAGLYVFSAIVWALGRFMRTFILRCKSDGEGVTAAIRPTSVIPAVFNGVEAMVLSAALFHPTAT